MKCQNKLLTLFLISLSSFTFCGCDNSNNSNPGNTEEVSEAETHGKEDVKITNLALNKTSLELEKGDNFQLIVNQTPNENDESLVWSSSADDVVKVTQNGFITALKEGFAEIVVSSTSGLVSDKCSVTVIPVELKSIQFDVTNYELSLDGSFTLSVDFFPSDISDKTLIWESSDENVVTVDSKGVVKTVSGACPGDEATITARSASNEKITATCNVSIKATSEDAFRKVEPGFTYSDLINNNGYAESCCPSAGNVNFLVIPVWFTDSTKTGLNLETREIVREDIKTSFFGSNEETGWRSVKTYYEEESVLNNKSQITLNGTVSEWYDCNLPSSDYYVNYYATSNLISKSVKWYFDNNPMDSRKNYDSDKDGYLDSVMLIYAYPDCEAEQSYNDNMWAYSYYLFNQANKTAPVPNAYIWASYDFIYNATNKVGNYYSSESKCKIDAHTYIHEMGHVFGLEDYYDYSYQFSPAGSFNMQDDAICGHDPYSVFALGWSNPYIPSKECTIKIKPFQQSHELILLTPEWNDKNSPFDEYLLLEYFTPTGLNEFDINASNISLIGGDSIESGIRLWHVDSRLIAYNNGAYDISTITSDPTAYKNGVLLAFSNTYYKSRSHSSYDYLSPLGVGYANYNILQLIKNNTSETYRSKSALEDKYLFKQGDTFNMNDFSSQFIKGEKLNDGDDLGFSFEITNMDNEYATIHINMDK